MNTSFSKMKKIRFLFPLLFIVGISVAAGVVMLLWNWLMPVLFHLTAISFWQALGLFVLSRMLFGGFRFCGGHRHRPPFSSDFKEKWSSMSDEEKESFKQQWKDRCGK